MPNSAITFNTSGLATDTSPGLVGTGAQTFAGAKTFNNGLEFTTASLSDAQATRLGLKQYLHGTTYNGGIAPTVTLNAGGGSLSGVQRAVFMPYQMQDGTWRLKFNVAVVLDAVSRTQVSIAVNGITSKNAAATQAICAFGNNTSAYVALQGVDANTNILYWHGASTSATNFRFSGDIELDSKPTWAY